MRITETFFSVSEELRLFGLSCLMGAVVGAAYDVVRVFRLIAAHNGFLTAVEDIFFLMLYAVSLTAFSEAAARSEMRLYFVIGNVIGYALYYVTIGSVVMGTIRKLFSVVGALLRLIFRPFRPCCAFLRKKATAEFVRNSKNIVKPIKKIKIVLLNKQHMLYNKMENTKEKEREMRCRRK
ncbi:MULTISPECIES: spore cortex biosynthesis protein YabQ [Ruminococcus]|uniref:Spore cortex biosynthesis protein YabQ n=1 Tax=Ruminococcus flavefaciens TaxID=1265 RepID=A0A1M7JSU4_RUMFL|nr:MULTISPECIES: spore cortex biosynthesis protein YabQ [Ruminococcus]MCR4796303.1 spore cortex biosynthesis protein YabQ [Ruminococcus sp.]SHM56139.1 spore cortex biosynthesis protein YabQ [Ruminococcus flavefaciens]